jgi:hypothetical protein
MTYMSRKIGDESTKRSVKWYVIQDMHGNWHASRDMIWGEGHKHRFLVKAVSVATAIKLGKEKVK